MADAVLSEPPVIPSGTGKPLSEASLVDLLPASIANDPTMRAVAAATENEIRRILEALPSVLLWSVLDRMEEPVLTHLAAMLHVDWWDEEWTAPQKRAFLLRQVIIHRKKGTPWAVEAAVALVYGEATVSEWFRYGGDRGCFLLEVNVLDSGLTDAAVVKIERMVEKYKRKSQHLCGIRFSMASAGVIYYGSAAFADEIVTVYPYVPNEVAAPLSPVCVGAALDMLETISLNELE